MIFVNRLPISKMLLFIKMYLLLNWMDYLVLAKWNYANMSDVLYSSSSEGEIPELGKSQKRMWTYLSLVFSLFYFVPLLFDPSLDNASLVISIVVYFIFLLTYICLVESKKQHQLVALIVFLVVIYGSLFVNIGGLVLFGYCMFILGYCWPLKTSITLAVVILILMTALTLYLRGPIWIYIMPFFFNGVGLFCFGVLEQRQTIKNLQLHRSQQSVKQLSAIAERERIGRDLHDLAGHALSSISLKAQLASKLLDRDKTAQAKEEINQLATLSQTLLSEIRNAVSDIKSLSFLEELQKTESLLFDKRIELHKTIDTELLKALSPSQEAHLTLIVKEALVNVLRHSNATKVILHVVENNEGMLEAAIQDNGTGIPSIGESNGLKGMRERALLMGGKLAVSVEDGFGITLTFKGK